MLKLNFGVQIAGLRTGDAPRMAGVYTAGTICTAPGPGHVWAARLLLGARSQEIGHTKSVIVKGETMEWTPEDRLELIWLLAAKSLDGPKGETHRMLMERIMFLCDMPNEFLEINRGNYEDVIGKPRITIEL
jgi:hypothetical protein